MQSRTIASISIDANANTDAEVKVDIFDAVEFDSKYDVNDEVAEAPLLEAVDAADTINSSQALAQHSRGVGFRLNFHSDAGLSPDLRGKVSIYNPGSSFIQHSLSECYKTHLRCPICC